MGEPTSPDWSNGEIHELEFVGSVFPQMELADPNVRLIDLFGRGLPDIVYSSDSSCFFWKNLGSCNFDECRLLENFPNGVTLAQNGVGLADMTGDGLLDLLYHGRHKPSGFFKASRDGGWKDFYPYERDVDFSPSDPNVRFLDLSGSGRCDALVSQTDCYRYYPNLGYKGFGKPDIIQRIRGNLDFPDVDFEDEHVRMADMRGEGLQDIVRFEYCDVVYWPNLKYGRFGMPITMMNPPFFDPFDQFNPRSVFFSDINGDGLADAVRIGSDGVRFWFNVSGTEWSEAGNFDETPFFRVKNARLIDILGNGSAGVLWSTEIPHAESSKYRFLELPRLINGT